MLVQYYSYHPFHTWHPRAATSEISTQLCLLPNTPLELTQSNRPYMTVNLNKYHYARGKLVNDGTIILDTKPYLIQECAGRSLLQRVIYIILEVIFFAGYKR